MLRERVWKLLTPEPDDVGWDRVVNAFLAVLITLNALAVALETVVDLGRDWRPLFVAFEIVSVTVFVFEYVFRAWSAPSDPRYAGRFGIVRYVMSPLALVDLFAILPSLLTMNALDLRFVRTLRLLRLARTFKIARYSPALHTLGRVVRARRAELGIAALAAAILVVCAASLLYFVEHDAQPQAFASIPGSLWWAVMTLTTVGYGDVYPVTPLGKVLASIIAVLGIGLFALPAAILSASFVEEVRGQRRTACPHCGRELPL